MTAYSLSTLLGGVGYELLGFRALAATSAFGCLAQLSVHVGRRLLGLQWGSAVQAAVLQSPTTRKGSAAAEPCAASARTEHLSEPAGCQGVPAAAEPPSEPPSEPWPVSRRRPLCQATLGASPFHPPPAPQPAVHSRA